ncbi:MAG: hypothetical protein V1890_02870 [Candidatus Zixiibacteriota bacterium]
MILLFLSSSALSFGFAQDSELVELSLETQKGGSVYNSQGSYAGGGEAVIPSPTFILPTSGKIMKEKPSLQERKQ